MATIYKYENSNLLNSNAHLICHQVNCCGKMASGVAKAIRDKWSIVYDKYMEVCDNRQQSLGYTQFVPLSDYYHNSNQCVVNMFAQDRYGYDGFKYTNYEAFYNCLREIVYFIKHNSYIKSIAFPYKIGCDRGGACWKVIYAMIEDAFKDLDITIEIHSLNKIN